MLILFSACAAWCLITRPLTGLVFAVPAISFAIWSARKRGLWRDIGYAVLVGAAVVSIVPIWSRFTTGHWSETPQSLYTRTYMPWDVIGFGLDSTPPLRALPPNQAREIDGFKALHKRHTAASLAGDAVVRLAGLRADVFTGWRAGLIGFFVIGLLSLTPALAMGGTTALLLFLAYLLYAHPYFWTVYYIEALPVVAMITVLGFVRAMKWLEANIERGGLGSSERREVAGGLVSIVLTLALLAGSLPSVRAERDLRNRATAPRLWLWDVMERLPTSRNILFVRDERNAPRTMVTNDIDPATARTLLAHDLGDQNIRLGLAVPDRSAYVIDMGAKTLIALPPVPGSAKP
jgi:hypothetical protein